MKKFIYLILFLSISVYSAEINTTKTVIWKGILKDNHKIIKLKWLTNYKKAFDIAKKENKIVMIDISKHDCPPCEFMKEVVMSGKEVKYILNKYFVLVSYYPENIPEKFRKQYFNFTPAILFYSKDGKFIKGIYGARPYKVFLKELKEIINKKG